MAEGYTWRDMRNEDRFRLPGPDHLGWWVTVSLLLAIILHAIAFLALGRIKIALGFEEARELRTAPLKLDQVEIAPPAIDDIAPDRVEEVPPPDAASLLEEIDVLTMLPENMEIDLSPEAVDPEFAIQPKQPLAEGAPDVFELDPATDFNLDTELSELGRTEDPLPPAAEGQVIVDPGDMQQDPELDRFTEEILKKGAGGTAAEGAIDGVVTLDDLVGLPENVLVGKKTMLPSDLLFEYNSAELRESARVGLMKLALLVERNPGLYCWIEGHTDLFGGNRYNLDLARKRAKSVKDYLTGSLRLDGDKIVTRGYGKTRALVPAGSIEEQALNRRVEIKMRREPPPDDEPVFTEPDPVPGAPPAPGTAPQPAPAPAPAPEVRQVPPAPAPEEAPPKAVLVRPMRVLPVQPAIEEPPKAVPVEEEAPPRAEPVREDPAPPRAEPVREDPPEQEPPRAEPVPE